MNLDARKRRTQQAIIQDYQWGTMEFLNKPEFKDVVKARSLLSLLEEKEAV